MRAPGEPDPVPPRHAPLDAPIERFGAAIPQYFVGHLERVDRIAAALPPAITGAGGSYRGAGVSACLRSGRTAADQILGHLTVTADQPVRSFA